MTIDLDRLRAVANEGEDRDCAQVTKRWLRALVRELEVTRAVRETATLDIMPKPTR